MANLKQYEKSEIKFFEDLRDTCNHAHAVMGGRDKRPERVALLKIMKIIDAEIKRSRTEENK